MALGDDLTILRESPSGKSLSEFLSKKRLGALLRTVVAIAHGENINVAGMLRLSRGAGGVLISADSKPVTRLESSGKVRRPLTLYMTQINNQPRVAIHPGTVSIGADDLSITEDGDVLTLPVPTQSKDLLLRLNLVPGSMTIAYLADPETIRYYAQGVDSVADWEIEWEALNQQSQRAEVDPVSGEPTVTGTYYVRIGRATVNGETVTLTNYKYGPLAINLCANGDLVIAQLDP